MKKLLILLAFVLCLSACQQEPAPATEPSTSSTTQSTTMPSTAEPETPPPTTEVTTEPTTQAFVPPEGTALDERDLANYQHLFTMQRDLYAVHPKNWYNTFLCVKFSSPEEIDWNELFHSGTGIPQEPISEAEEAYLLSQGFAPEMDWIRIPAEEMDAIALQYLGLTPAESQKIGLDSLTHFAQTDCYYRMVSDAQSMWDFVIYAGAVLDSGDIRLYYTDVVAEQDYVITLQSRWPEGEMGYRILSNLPMES